jgi:hypothetical protein
MRARLRVGLRALAIGALIIGVVSPAAAQGSQFTATLSPIKVTLKPGQLVTRYFELTLAPDQRRTVFNARIEDWWRSEDGGQTFYGPPGSLAQSCGAWTTLNPIEAVAEPGKPLRVRVTITVPDAARAGGYWCALALDEIPDPTAVSAGGVEVRFMASVAVGIFVYIEPVERKIEIVDVEVSSRSAVARVRVTGNTPVAIEGRVEFIAAGQNVATMPVARTTILTEPVRLGAVRVDLPSAEKLPSGRYLVRVILDIGLDHYIGVEREVDLKRDAQALR